jgi:hypothetical protein
MATLNIIPVVHGSKSESYRDGSTIAFNVFPSDTVAANNRIVLVQAAMAVLDRLADSEPQGGQCNAHFRSLGRGVSFTSLWKDPSVYVNYSPSTEVGFYAACHSNNRDLTVTAWCLDTQNRWMVAATLCHELGHAAGAPGNPAGPQPWSADAVRVAHQAELSVKRCYFGSQYEPNILGSVDTLYRNLRSNYA